MNVVTDIILPAVIATIMLGMGMTLVPADFRRVLATPKAILTGAASLLLIIPVIGYTFAQLFDLPPELAVGLFLVATCPGGMLSNLMTYFGKGDLAMSISLTAAVTTVYVFVIPFEASFALNTFMGDAQQFDLPVLSTLGKVLMVTVAPVLVGMLVRNRAEGFAKRAEGPVSKITGGFLILIFVVLLAEQAETLMSSLQQVALPVLALNATAITVAFVLTGIVGVERRQRIAIVIEHSIRQEGTAIFIAATLIGNATMTLPLLLNAAIGMTLTLVFLGLTSGKRPLLMRDEAVSPEVSSTSG